MPYVFEECPFKNYLRNHAERSWFSKDASNARHENHQGIRDLHDYSNRYTVRVKEILKDPRITMENVGFKAGAGVGAAVSGVELFFAGALAALVPPAAPAVLTFLGASIVSGGAAAVCADNINRPQEVCFTLTGDNSEWIVQDVPVDGIRQVAINICEWSNQVYNEKF